MKLLITLAAVLLLTGCVGKMPPPPQNNVISIPVTLVNVENTEVGVLPDEPSTKALIKINAKDPADEALETTIEYTKELHDYAKEVTKQLIISEAENAVMRDKLKKIKNYIVLSQPRIQPVN